MVRVKKEELEKAFSILMKESADGHNITIKIDATKVYLESVDRNENGVSVCLHDVEYPFFPTITKTERL